MKLYLVSLLNLCEKPIVGGTSWIKCVHNEQHFVFYLLLHWT